MNDYNEYKIEQLRNMLTAETSEDAGGYGAHLDHWSGRAKPINLDADAIRVLINYYESCQRERRTMYFTLHTYDLQEIVIALIHWQTDREIKAKQTDDEYFKNSYLEEADQLERLIDRFNVINNMADAGNDYNISFTAKN